MAVKFTYYGGMCMLIERSDGFKILMDPYITKNKQTQKEAKDFYDVDLIYVTHKAGDHYGDVVELMENSKAMLVAPSDVIIYVKKEAKIFLEEKKKDPENGRLFASAYGDERVFGATHSHTVQAIHLSKGSVNGVPVYGVPSGFVLEVEPGVTYYHPGDTALYGDIKLIRDLFHPNIMCVGIGGIKPLASREMGPREAAISCSWVGADIVIPTHYMEGGTDLEDFLRYMDAFYPQATILPDVENPFYLIPTHVEPAQQEVCHDY
jgi:L-ascorbate metabolism protein UlaG (beta-lactamase superfamily)